MKITIKAWSIGMSLMSHMSLLCAAGCSKKSPQEQVVGHLRTLAKVMEDNQGDCGKIADGMVSWSNKNSQEFDRLKKEMEEIPAEQKEAMKEKYKEEIQTLMPAFVKASMACAKDPKFSEAMKNIKIK